MPLRRYAHVAAILDRPQTIHYRGLPVELTGGVDRRTVMPWARVVLLEEEEPGGSATLWRWDANGEFAGDTWHESVEDAMGQAEFEYGVALGAWRPVPAHVQEDVLKTWVLERLTTAN
jgi:hypothetical protein